MSPRPFSTRLAMPLAQVCAMAGQHAPYLRALMQRRADTVRALQHMAPETLAAQICAQVRQAAAEQNLAALDICLRRAKADMHVLCALADIGGVWPLETVTGTLSAFADAAMQAALLGAARALEIDDAGADGPVPGLFVMAMGKYGARELNYSSDIDFTVFFDPERGASWLGRNPVRTTGRLVRRLVHSIGAVTAEGYVFRTDMRLRPDPASTHPAVPTPAAHVYYESVGQNWERAALIKARPCAGDETAAAAFLARLQPFIWRRTLDFAAIEDIHAMKRQIHVSLKHSGFETPGHDVKLGRGGIREIEFFVQTQQLVLGGRDPDLRCPQTLAALHALAGAGHISAGTAKTLRRCYRTLRRAEHGAQMLQDRQTHTLPEDDGRRAAIAALLGAAELSAFDGHMRKVFFQVHTCYAKLFAQSQPLSARRGSLVFTGVEDDPATLATLAARGFADAPVFLQRMRGWHGGAIRATRSAQARRLLTRLGPALVDALANTKDPDGAFAAFTVFFEGLNAGVQPLSLFIARPVILDMLVALLHVAPRLATAFSKDVSVLDAMLDPGFSTPLGDDPAAGARRLIRCAEAQDGFETRLGAVQRMVLEERLRIGVQVLMQKADPRAAAQSYSALADAAIGVLSRSCAAQMEERFGPPPGPWAILGLGSLGARTMREGSDLDLVVLYQPGQESPGPAPYFARFARRLISALGAPGRAGALYAIDMTLRPSGRAGPVAVSWGAFMAYYRKAAWSWEVLALMRARVVCASSADFANAIGAYLEEVLAQKRDLAALRRDVADMRRRLREEFGDCALWDIKHAPGGITETLLMQQLFALAGSGLETQAPEQVQEMLGKAHGFYLSLLQILHLCLAPGTMIPPFAPPLQNRLAERLGAADFSALEQRLADQQHQISVLSEHMLMS